MRRILALGLGLAVLSTVGCMHAKVVEQHPDWGIVAVKSPDQAEDAHALIRKLVGDNYTIVDNYDPKGRPSEKPPLMGMNWYIKYAKKNPTGTMTPAGPEAQAGFRTGPTAGSLPAPDMTGIQPASFNTPAPATSPAGSPGMGTGLPVGGVQPQPVAPTIPTTSSGMPATRPSYNPYEK